ncbi:uncharacterized protein P884DRAFT_295181 [Thermothelomyces heterothallicus CBS 202.75]|uniref:uncharacterized protein n=1 Tax=Thermothelomyces heterothallicus CBS 202.75 TaxID=1149848 RepID=UPI0037420FB9
MISVPSAWPICARLPLLLSSSSPISSFPDVAGDLDAAPAVVGVLPGYKVVRASHPGSPGLVKTIHTIRSCILVGARTKAKLRNLLKPACFSSRTEDSTRRTPSPKSSALQRSGGARPFQNRAIQVYMGVPLVKRLAGFRQWLCAVLTVNRSPSWYQVESEPNTPALRPKHLQAIKDLALQSGPFCQTERAQ